MERVTFEEYEAAKAAVLYGKEYEETSSMENNVIHKQYVCKDGSGIFYERTENGVIGFIPEQARTYLGLDTVGVAEFFALLYIAYEVVSIFKNMALCGLPVKKVWEKVREFLAKYTDELPDTDELDGDSTTGNVEEHRTQER